MKPTMSELSRDTFVYRLYNADGELLYVGITRNPAQRKKQHAREKSWWHEVARWTLHGPLPRDVAGWRETWAIQDERPLHNIAGTGSYKQRRVRAAQSMRGAAPKVAVIGWGHCDACHSATRFPSANDCRGWLGTLIGPPAYPLDGHSQARPSFQFLCNRGHAWESSIDVEIADDPLWDSGQCACGDIRTPYNRQGRDDLCNPLAWGEAFFTKHLVVCWYSCDCGRAWDEIRILLTRPSAPGMAEHADRLRQLRTEAVS